MAPYRTPQFSQDWPPWRERGKEVKKGGMSLDDDQSDLFPTGWCFIILRLKPLGICVHTAEWFHHKV